MELAMRYIHSIQLLWLLHSTNPPVTFILLSQRVQHIITGNIPANNSWDVNFCISFGQHHGTGLLHMKKCNFLHNGHTVETIAKGGRKLKKRRKGHFQQSYILALSTHRSSPKPANIQIAAGNYEGKDLTYNTSWRKLQEVKQVTTKVVENMQWITTQKLPPQH